MRIVDLEAIADALETAAGATTSANPNAIGRWSRIAVASETLAGATTTANPNLMGFMKRTAVALESIAGTSGTEENPNERGYMKRIVDALEVQAGAVTAGSLESRMVTAAGDATFGAGYDADASALFARMTSAPDETRKGHIDTLILALKAAGVWSKMDVLYILAAHDAQAARLDWKGTYDATANGTPTFTTDRGYTGSLSNGLTTTYSPELASLGFAVTSAHLGGFTLTHTANNLGDVAIAAGANAGATTNQIFCDEAPRSTIIASSPSPASSPAGNSPHYIVGSRTDVTTLIAYRNAVAGATNTTDVTTNEVPEAGMDMANRNSGRQLAVAHAGSGFTAQNVIDTDAAFRAYLTALGVAGL